MVCPRWTNGEGKHPIALILRSCFSRPQSSQICAWSFVVKWGSPKKIWSFSIILSSKDIRRYTMNHYDMDFRPIWRLFVCGWCCNCQNMFSCIDTFDVWIGPGVSVQGWHINCGMCGYALHTAFSKFCDKWIVELACAEWIQSNLGWSWVMQSGVLQYGGVLK